MSQPEKLSQLRAKTDRQLLHLATAKLELAERSLTDRECALEEAQELLLLMNGPEKDELVARLNGIRESPRVLTASSY